MAFDLDISNKSRKSTKHRNEVATVNNEIMSMENRWNELEIIRKCRPLTNYEKRRHTELEENEKFQAYIAKQGKEDKLG